MSRSLDIRSDIAPPSVLEFPAIRESSLQGFFVIYRKIQEWVESHAGDMSSSVFLPSVLVGQLPSDRKVLSSRLSDLPNQLAIRQPMLQRGILFLRPENYQSFRAPGKVCLTDSVAKALKEELFIPEAGPPALKGERSKLSESLPPEVSFPGDKTVPPLKGIFSVRVQDSGSQKADPIVIEAGRLNLSVDELETIRLALNGIVRTLLK